MLEKFDYIMQELSRFRSEHDWNRYYNPKNLAEAISIESSELLKIFLWKSKCDSRHLDAKEIEHAGQEIADIFIYLACLCDELKIDMLDKVANKLKVNETKFPTETTK
jgi:dCTP diphosphatase